MFASKDTLLTRPSGYNIARSVRLRSSASAYLNRTFGSGSRTTWTWSAWVKRGALGTSPRIFQSSGAGGFGVEGFIDFANDNIRLRFDYNGGSQWQLITTAVYRDPSAWYHIVCVADSTNATASNRLRIYVNGVQVTAFSTANYPTQNANGTLNQAYSHGLGANASGGDYFDGYHTEINFIDGQALTPSSFGETDSSTGVWKPKAYSGTYGTNGFELNFSDNSNNTAATIGKDYSGNGNNWTPNNISVTAGTTYDSMTDVPTLTSATVANYAVLSPLWASSVVSGGNLNIVGDSNSRTVVGSITSTTGKWYAEGTFTSGYATNGWFFVWDTSTPYVYGNIPSTTGQTGAYYKGTNGDISKSVTGTNTSIGTYSTWTNGDIIGMAFDADAGTISFYKNNTLQVTITDSAFIGRPLTFGIYYYAGNASMNFGQRPFSYTPPTGFVALNTYNLPASTITNGAAYMAATLYTGTGATQSISNAVNGVSMQPDFVWIKGRNYADNHTLWNTVVGAQKSLSSDTTTAETTRSTALTAFASNGFTLGTDTIVNYSVGTYVAWQWKAGGTSASNTNGTITSTVSAGATQGFSVVTYTGTGSSATVGHGLGVAPSMIICKARGQAENWAVYHSSLSNAVNVALFLNLTNAVSSASNAYWNSTAPSSTVFSVNTATTTNAANTMVAYCFAAVAGYSAFGSYTGNGSTDGPFVYTGFRPRFIMFKKTSATSNWSILDTSRDNFNVADNPLLPNTSGAESTSTSGSGAFADILSNGFKLRGNSGDINDSGATYIYACFAENPFKNALAR